MLFLEAKIAASGLLAAAAVASLVGATPASAATETVTVTIQVTRNSAPGVPSVLYGVGDERLRCAGVRTAKPTIEVAASQGATIRLYSVSSCYSGLGGKASVVADATKTVQVEL